MFFWQFASSFWMCIFTAIFLNIGLAENILCWNRFLCTIARFSETLGVLLLLWLQLVYRVRSGFYVEDMEQHIVHRTLLSRPALSLVGVLVYRTTLPNNIDKVNEVNAI